MTISKTKITQWPYPISSKAEWSLFFSIKNKLTGKNKCAFNCVNKMQYATDGNGYTVEMPCKCNNKKEVSNV